MKKLHFIFGIFLGLLSIIMLSSNGGGDFGHGYASSGDGLCGDCHAPGAAGTVSLSGIGIPGTPLEAGKSYNLTVVISRTGSAPKGGFQMSILKPDGSNAGEYSNPATSDTQIQLHQRCQNAHPEPIFADNCNPNAPSVEYFEHLHDVSDPGFPFINNLIQRSVTWTAPTDPGTVTFTIGAVLTDGVFGLDTDGDKYTFTTFSRQVVYPPVSISITHTDVTCPGGNDGAAFGSAAGGNGNYSYKWSNGATSADIYNLTPGNYMLTVTSGGGLTGTGSVQILQPAAMLLLPTIAPVTCPGGNNGSISLSPSNGTAPYSYLWSNDATTNPATNLGAGSYTVTVTDANNCTKTGAYNVPGPPAFSLPAVVVPASCFGLANGSIDLTPGGGSQPYTYQWNNGKTTQDISSLAAGAYTVTITDSKSCTKASAPFTVNQPPALALTDTVTQVTCFGLLNGSINLTPSGGSPGYSYLWSNDSTTQDLAKLAAGTYSVVVTDQNNCTKTDTVTVSQPSALTVSDSVSPPKCFGGSNGSINLTPSGGSPGYSYLWSNDSTTQNLANLAAGTYSVVVTDQRNCTLADTVTVTQPSAIVLDYEILNATCFGLANGAVDLIPAGGTPGYSYLWSNGAATQDVINLKAGTYSVVVTDQNNCTRTDTVAVTQPAAIVLNAAILNATCFGLANGAVDLSPAGGAAGYTYAWSNGANTQDIFNLTAGTYSVVVTDQNNCTRADTVTITQPPAITLNALATNATCFGLANGTVDLTPLGGTPDYTYAWSNGASTQDIANLTAGTYSVVVTDQNNCSKSTGVTVGQPSLISLSSSISNVTCFGLANGSIDLTPGGGTPGYAYLWSNNATTQDIAGLTEGMYSVTISDANNCTNTGAVTVMQPPTPLSIALTFANATCFGLADGSVNLVPAGGTPGYTYLWSNGSTEQSPENLPADAYSVTVTDANHCTKTDAVTIDQPTEIQLSAAIANAVCFGSATGSIDLSAGGGTPGYGYVWSNGATTQDIGNLKAGTYTVTTTDLAGCEQVEAFAVGESPELLVLPTVINISCFASPTGGILLEVTGGTSPYTYLWSTGDTTRNLSGVPTGLYSATIADANGCTVTIAGEIVQAPPMSLQLIPEQADCFGAASGSITAGVSGGAGVYTFLWSNGATTQHLSGITAGTYTCTVTDAAGCTVSDSATVTQPASSLSAAADSIVASVSQGATGAVYITVNGATPPYTFTWVNSETGDTLSDSEDLLGVPAGQYQLLVTDAGGCTATLQAVVDATSSIQATGGVTHFVLFPNPNDGHVTIRGEPGNDTPLSVRIGGTSGQVCYSGLMKANELKNGVDINLEHLPAGVYMLQLWSSDTILGRRLFVVNR